MIISVAGGFNNLLLEPPLPAEVFSGLLEPRLIGADKRAPLKIRQYGDVYTGLVYGQEVETLPSLPPVAYGRRVCEYLGKAGINVEFDEFTYESSPETVLMMATEPALIQDVQGSSRHF